MLAWAAAHERIILTHDIRALLPDAYHRLRLSQPLTGVFAVAQDSPLGRVIDDLALLAEYTTPDEWLGRIVSSYSIYSPPRLADAPRPPE